MSKRCSTTMPITSRPTWCWGSTIRRRAGWPGWRSPNWRGAGSGQIGRTLDLGCGTGLMGERLRRSTSFLEGVDLSGAMLAEAERKGIYDRLEKAELTVFLAGHAGGFDLVAASDVLNYCGALAPVFAAVQRRLVKGGLFAFTLERHDGAEAMTLQSSLRYAHSEAGARAACTEAGFEIVALETAPLRQDRGAPVMGIFVVARKPAEMAVALVEAAETPVDKPALEH